MFLPQPCLKTPTKGLCAGTVHLFADLNDFAVVAFRALAKPFSEALDLRPYGLKGLHNAIKYARFGWGGKCQLFLVF